MTLLTVLTTLSIKGLRLKGARHPITRGYDIGKEKSLHFVTAVMDPSSRGVGGRDHPGYV